MTEDRPVPPYEDRKRAADPPEGGDTEKQGADGGGAARHRTSDEADPGGGTASPAREQPAEQVAGSGQEDPGTGPAHMSGTTRGEDQKG